jgi:hypothetical protein
MITRLICVFALLLTLIPAASLVSAGGPAVAPCAPPVSYPPRTCAPGGTPPSSAYWGDAPFPGLCGGVVALPFLVVGSLLGGNSSGYVGPPGAGYGPGYAPASAAPCGQPAPAPYQCAPPVQYGPPMQAPYQCGPPAPVKACPPPSCAPPSGPYGAAGPSSGGMFTGLPCLDLCTGLLGNITGGMNFLN